MPGKDWTSNEQRQQFRFPWVGIDLLYSPLEHMILSGVSQTLIQASSHDISLAGIAFDIKQPLESGQNLLVVIKTPEGDDEVMTTEVRWCKHLAAQQYRVGVSIISVEKNTVVDNKDSISDSVGHGIAVPAGASFICPACEQRSWFVLVGQQEGVPPPTIMPLYNCSECHTTRSIPSLLSHNRDITEE